MSINNSALSLISLRHHNVATRGYTESIRKLASGLRISKGNDAPADLIISEGLRAQSRGLQTAMDNTQEAHNVLGTAEGGMKEMQELLHTLTSLAVHVGNSTTLPLQAKADQAEIDSALNSVEAMSQHTRYADKFLLNGAQAITFNTNLQRNDSLDVNILDSQLTRVDRLFKRDNVSVAITHDGVQIPALNENVNQTTRAYLEADDNYATANIDGAYLTEDQEFRMAGNAGASSFRFGSGAHLGEVVQAINSRTGSTGVKAQLIFSSRVTSQVGAITGEDYSVGGDGGVPQVYGAEVNKSDTGGSGKVVSVAAAADVQTRLRAGMNTDGQGRVFARVLDPATGGVEYFKDKECTVMIGTGNNGTFTPANNCGLNADDIILTLDAATAQAGDVYTIALGGMVLDESLGGGDFINSEDLSFSGFGPNGFNFFSGIDLGHNTDAYGRLYFEATGPANDRTISIYSDGSMSNESLVARGTDDLSGGAGTQAIVLEEMNDSELNATLSFPGVPSAERETGSIAFEELGVRLYAEDYGAEGVIRFENMEGALFTNYDTDTSSNPFLIKEGTSLLKRGHEAEIIVNGQGISTRGLSAESSAPEIAGEFALKAGELGRTTIAQAGHEVGGLFSRAGAMRVIADPAGGDFNDILTYATSARHHTTEVMENFSGGMNLQIGQHAGGQDRTVLGIQSMALANLGVVDDEGRRYSLEDVRGGGSASLKNNAQLAMKIISKALDDVGQTRGRLGALQNDMIRSQGDFLYISNEMITRTESSIRDTHMAEETITKTKFQILESSSTNVIARGNLQRENILDILKIVETAVSGSAA